MAKVKAKAVVCFYVNGCICSCGFCLITNKALAVFIAITLAKAKAVARGISLAMTKA